MSTPPPAFIWAADYGMDPAKTDCTNTTSLNKAISAAQAQGGAAIVIPPGTYTITGTIRVTASGITLQGANQHATVLQFNNGSSHCLVVGGQTQRRVWRAHFTADPQGRRQDRWRPAARDQHKQHDRTRRYDVRRI